MHGQDIIHKLRKILYFHSAERNEGVTVDQFWLGWLSGRTLASIWIISWAHLSSGGFMMTLTFALLTAYLVLAEYNIRWMKIT